MLPVATVEIGECDRRYGRRINAIDIDAHTIGVRPRYVERLDAAMLAKIVLRRVCVERVFADVGFVRQQAKIVIAYDEVQETRHTADTAIALCSVNFCRRIDLESHFAAMATTCVCRHDIVLTRSTERTHRESVPDTRRVRRSNLERRPARDAWIPW